jgi:hypothetical protein
MKRRVRVVLVSCLVAAFFLSVLSSDLGLATAVRPPIAPTSSSAIIINPRINAILNPGQTVTGQLQVGNQDNVAPLDLSLRVIDFSYTNQTGTAKLFLANEPQTTWSLKPYLSIPSTLHVPASGNENFSYTIKIPSNLGAGSYYSAIEYASGLGDSGNVGLSAAGVTLMFVTVSGNAKEHMTLEKFGAFNETGTNEAGNFTHYITTTQPNSIAFSVKNHGNVVESPAGSIIINKWGRHYETIASANPNSLLTLIGQTRLYVPCIKNQTQVVNNPATPTDPNACVASGLTPGHYSASLAVYYGQNGNPTQEIIATASFWYIPVWLLVIILIVFLLIIYFGYRTYLRIKSIANGTSTIGHTNTYRYRLSSKRTRTRR